MSPVAALLKSRKFLLLVFDTTASLVLFFATKYFSPAMVEDVQVLILGLQPVFVAIIVAISVEDAASARARLTAGGLPR